MAQDTFTVLVAGSGVMGRGIADSFVRAGYTTAVLSRNPANVSGIHPDVAILDELPAATPELIIETIPEVMDLKLELNARIEEAYQGAAILASNTSSLPLQKLADNLRHAEMFCGIHYFQPADVTPIVEVARVAQSNDQTIETSLAMLRQTGKTPITLSEPVDGLLINRLQQAIYHEAYDLIERGICTAQDIDLAAKMLLGPRMSVTGMVEQKDLSGLDTHALSQRELVPTLHLSREPSAVVQRKFAEGNIGAKSGQGFFDWREMDIAAYRRDTGALLTAVLDLLERERPDGPPPAAD